MSGFPLATVLFLGIGSACTFAQAPGTSSGDQGADSVVQQSSSHPEGAVQAGKFRGQFTGLLKSSQEQFTGLLNGTGLISMDSENGLTVSAEARGGWDSNPLNSPDSVSSSVYSLSPYIAFHGVSEKSKFIVQYQPTFLGYPSGTYSGQTMHAASVQADGNLSERLGWKINIQGSYGQNGARFAGPLQSVAVGEVPGTVTSTASYLPNSGSVTYVLSSFETGYRKSE